MFNKKCKKMSLDRIKNLINQKGTILILEFIHQKEEPNLSQLKKGLLGQISQPPLYNALNILLEEKLIEESYTKHPTERVFSITEKGKQVLEKLIEINVLLEEE